jgi:hypothetical protein
MLAFMERSWASHYPVNLIQLVFFWALISLFSFLLVSYRHQSAQALDGARMALAIRGRPAVCVFAAVLLVGGERRYPALRPYLRRSVGPPLLRHIEGSRIFDRLLVLVSWRLARWLERMLGTRRLLP